MKITLSGNPISVNRLYRGRRFLTSEGEAVKYGYAAEAYNQYRKKPMKGGLKVSVFFTFADRRKHDIDNCLKAVLDSMSGILWEDDSQISELHVFKSLATEPSIEIWCTEIK